MAKYNEFIREKAITLIEDEYFSVSQVCKVLDINRQTFYSWMGEKEDFNRGVNEALDHRRETLLALAYSSVKKRLQEGKTVIEKDTYVPDERNPENLKLKSRVIIRKNYQPDLRTIKMLLERNDKQEKIKDNNALLPVVDEEIAQYDNEVQSPAEEKEWKVEVLEDVMDSDIIQENETVRPNEVKVNQRRSKPKKMTAKNVKKHVRFVKFS